MPSEEFQILAPEPRAHSEALCDLIPKVFSGLGYYAGRDLCRQSYVHQSHYDWHASRIGCVGDKLVTHFGVWDYLMRIGSGCVRTGGIGAVATDADYRKRGFMERTIQASLAAMRARGYDMTILFGIDNFYHRFGYARAWSDTHYFVAVNDLPVEAPTLPVRKFTPRPRQDFHDLYNRSNATATGTAVRPTFSKSYNFMGRPPCTGYAWSDAAGALAGYVILHQSAHRIECLEHCGDPEQTLRVLGQLGRKWQSSEVRFEALATTDELARRLRRGTCRTETQYRQCGAAMIHLLNLLTTLEKISAELSFRLQRSPLAGWHGALRMTGPAEAATLCIADGQVHVSSPVDTPHTVVAGEELAQLIIGTDEPAEILDANQTTVTGDAAALLAVLFPAQHPQLSPLDRY